MMEKQFRGTRLHDWHTAHGATLADFGGYEMPLWYSSAKNEHMAVLNRAGLFDTSHMAAVMVTGRDALDLLQRCFTNDMSRCVGKDRTALYTGRCVYGLFLDGNGHVIDDAIVYMLEENHYMVVVNAGMGTAISAHLRRNCEHREAHVQDLTDSLGKMDIQGPLSAKVMTQVLSAPGKVFEKMPYFSFKGYFDGRSPLADAVRLKNKIPVLLSRTGYTGEFGFELFVSPEHLVPVWELVMDAGAANGLISCGLAARDSLRTGAVLPLSHQDIGPWPFINTPWSFALPLTPDGKGFSKDFIGARALKNVKQPEYTYGFAGNDLRKVTLPAVVLDTSGAEIGVVLTCASDMGIGRQEGRIYSVASRDKPQNLKAKGLCCGFVKVNRQLAPGQPIVLKDGRRKIPVCIERDIRPDRTARKPMKDMI